MAVKEVLVCDKCGSDIEEDPLLGDRQGGTREIRHMGTTWRLALCVKCAAPLFELFEEFVPLTKPGGTMPAEEVVKYLPRIVDEADVPQRPSSARDARMIDDGPRRPTTPTFSGGE